VRIGVTGITGTVGHALGDLLQSDGDVTEVVGISSHPFDTAARGWTKVRHEVVDVRDAAGLRSVLFGCDVVVHLAFALHGVTQRRRTLEAVNVGGTRNAWDAAVAAGATRFVHASSAAAYGIRELPQPIPESAGIRADRGHFYVEHKARAEEFLRRAAERPGVPELTMLRPVGIAGPHAAVSVARTWPAPLRRAATFAFGSGLRPPLPAPPVPMHFLHETDAAAAFHLAAKSGPAGTFNIAPDDVLDGEEVVRALGFRPVPLPQSLRLGALRGLAAIPPPLPAWTWLNLVRVPYVLDTRAAGRELKWAPHIASMEALGATRAAWSA
jgi:nucleoside-diphosphate-sugar epimerase